MENNRIFSTLKCWQLDPSQRPKFKNICARLAAVEEELKHSPTVALTVEPTRASPLRCSTNTMTRVYNSPPRITNGYNSNSIIYDM